MEADLPIDASLTIPGEELWFRASRAGGPGGQHVNTTASRVTLIWKLRTSAALDEEARERLLFRLASRLTDDGELQISVTDSRSQLQNRETARQRLAELVRAARVTPKARRPTRPSKGSQERRIAAKKARSQALGRRRSHDD